MSAPLRMSARRANALVLAVDAQCAVWHDEIAFMIRSTDPNVIRQARVIDQRRAAALEAVSLIQVRYLGRTTPVVAQPKLFDDPVTAGNG